MNGMDKKKNELPPEVAEQLSEFIIRENGLMLDRLSELDKRLANTNFLTNGGGAVAVLAFMGTNTAPSLIKVSLVLFTLGVIATGIELRALLIYFGEVSQDNHRRNRGFNSNQMTVGEFGNIPENVGKISKWVNHYAGWGSQLLFAAGVIIGAASFLCSGT
jgi:hypothetical protein